MESFSAVCRFFGLTSVVVEHGGILQHRFSWSCVKELANSHWTWGSTLAFRIRELNSLVSRKLACNQRCFQLDSNAEIMEWNSQPRILLLTWRGINYVAMPFVTSQLADFHTIVLAQTFWKEKKPLWVTYYCKTNSGCVLLVYCNKQNNHLCMFMSVWQQHIF